MKSSVKNQKNSLIRSFYIAVLSLMLITVSATPTQAQQQAQLLGIDHVGVNVPDLKQAVTFFQDVLGFTPVTNIGPVPLDTAWKKANNMQPGTGPVTIKMVRAGYGANIELFEYADNKGIAQQPGADDIGASHIAFYTSDIKAAIHYLKLKDVKFLGEPFTMPVGDTKGETFVYFLTPWGSKLELVSYPDGKGYEKNKPKTLLWSPKNAVAKPAKNK